MREGLRAKIEWVERDGKWKERKKERSKQTDRQRKGEGDRQIDRQAGRFNF